MGNMRSVALQTNVEDGVAEERASTYANLVLDSALGADGEVLTWDGRIRTDNNAFDLHYLIASSATSPLPSVSWYGFKC